MNQSIDLELLLFNSQQGTDTAPKRGDVLLAGPLMQGFPFHRSVILMLDSDAQKGHMGLILNHQLPLTIADAFPEWKTGSQFPVFAGGPVDLERLFLLHRLGNIFSGSKEVIPGLYVGGNLQEVRDYCDSGADTEGMLRFCLGYSGWEVNQLESELLQHVWAVGSPISPDKIFDGEGNEYWRREVKRLGESYRSWLVVPPKDQLN